MVRGVAGLFEQLPARGLFERFVFLTDDIAGQAGGQFEYVGIDRGAVLLDQEQFAVRGDCCDTDNAAGAGADHKLPAFAITHMEELAGESDFIREDW